MKRILLLISITIGLLTSCTSSTTEKTSNVLAEKSPKNIIMIVGDGMGPAYTTAYRYYKDDLSTPLVDLTIFDELLVGMAARLNAGLKHVPAWLLYILCATHIAWLFYLGLTGGLGVEPIKALEHAYGAAGLKALVATLAVTPLTFL